ncbi:hypothetical protein [Jannaschia sp. R86511]|uniref:hypothetical protein n=1 Tax=Jannaschia sp. R86511 TaxID=3093853 RepID=UPI0036D430F1
MQKVRTVRAPDAGDVVVGWLVRLVAVFAVVGVLLFDGVSLGIAELAVTDTAAAAARAAGQELDTGATAQEAYLAAREAADTDHDLNDVPADRFQVTADGAVTLTVRRTVPTLVLHHVPGSDAWLVAEATAGHDAG